MTDENGKSMNSTSNVVYKGFFRNLPQAYLISIHLHVLFPIDMTRAAARVDGLVLINRS
jgi:hypothetical protein